MYFHTCSQWSCLKTGLICWQCRVPVTRRAAAFCTAWRRQSRLSEMVNSSELQESGREETNAWTTVFSASANSTRVTGWGCRKYQYADRHTVLTCADMVSWLLTTTLRSRAVSTVVANDDRMVISRTVTLSICCREPRQMTSVFETQPTGTQPFCDVSNTLSESMSC